MVIKNIWEIFYLSTSVSLIIIYILNMLNIDIEELLKKNVLFFIPEEYKIHWLENILFKIKKVIIFYIFQMLSFR